MKLSLSTKLKSKPAGHNGFGYATLGMLESLERLGYHIELNDSSADVEICFDQPHHWKFSPDKYKIGYLPWESTALIDGWLPIINECDEIWTPSPIIADWFKKYMNVEPPVYVYEHGVDHVWEPRKREVTDTVKFLNVGAEACRKAGWDTVRLFRRAFPGNEDVSLTMKILDSGWNGIPKLGRVTYINEKYSFDEQVNLFMDHHVYVYPSRGEGFGLTPLQAIATGMPTITVPAWAPYANFLDPMLSVSAELKASPFQKVHPGKIWRPDFDEVVDRMRYAYNNYEQVHQDALDTAELVHIRYDWDKITDKMFSDLKARLNL